MNRKQVGYLLDAIIVILAILALFLTSCERGDRKAPAIQTMMVQISAPSGKLMYTEESGIDIYEGDYKGHTYLCTFVRESVAMTHAGHCKCYARAEK